MSEALTYQLKFYTEMLSFQVAREPTERAVFLACSKIHHDLALFRAAPDALPVTPGGLGLNHMALQVEDLEALREFYYRLKMLGLEIDHTRGHGVTKSVYFHAPDGNAIERFCNGHASPAEGLQAMQTQESLDWDLVIT